MKYYKTTDSQGNEWTTSRSNPKTVIHYADEIWRVISPTDNGINSRGFVQGETLNNADALRGNIVFRNDPKPMNDRIRFRHPVTEITAKEYRTINKKDSSFTGGSFIIK